MAFFFSRKRIQHLARYFGLAGLICLVGYEVSPLSQFFLVFLGPSFFLVAWIRTHIPFLANLIPNEPFFNNFFLLFPAAVLYFGLIGFQLKNIINETGRIRLFILLLFVGLLIYIHYLAFQEISLYWK